MVFISVIKHVLLEKRRLMKELQQIEKQLSNLPDGKINCVHNGKFVKWFHSDGHTQTYIPKSQREYAQKLALKRFLLEKQKECKKELKALEFYQKHTVGENRKSVQFLSKDSAYQELLQPFYQLATLEADTWSNVSYSKNQNYPEQLKYKSCKNEYVRSKSEALIAMNLYIEKIAYRYECELKLGNVILYPDFTILHPMTGEEIYWEHFGMMDTQEYRKNAADKINLYVRNGIYPGERLITTYETQEQPLDTTIVQKLIAYHFKEDGE